MSQPISCEVRLLSPTNEGLAPQTGRPDVEETWFLAGGKPSGLSHMDKDISIRDFVWILPSLWWSVVFLVTSIHILKAMLFVLAGGKPSSLFPHPSKCHCRNQWPEGLASQSHWKGAEWSRHALELLVLPDLEYYRSDLNWWTHLYMSCHKRTTNATENVSTNSPVILGNWYHLFTQLESMV